MQLVLLSGGSGKRLWPLSNNARSKQFLPLLTKNDGTQESMVQRVVSQVRESNLTDDITIATNVSQLDIIFNQLGESVSVVAEPERRDTFPAIALAISYLRFEKKCSNDEVAVIMPCDSYTDLSYFETVKKMVKCIENNVADLVLMGISPTCPSEKFGYIIPQVISSEINESLQYYNVVKFTEKPNIGKARELLRMKALWNGGVFAFRIGYMMKFINKYILSSNFEDVRLSYSHFPKISFDYEVVEKASSVVVVPFGGQWKDLGTWNTLTEELPQKVIGNALIGEHCENTHIINELKIPIYADGINNTIIVASHDGILVSSKEYSEDIKKNVEDLSSRPMYEERRWGTYRIIDNVIHESGQISLTKSVIINPGMIIPYHSHCQHIEILTFVQGEGILVLDGKEKKVKVGDSIVISNGHIHAIKAISQLNYIEVHIGDCLGDDDVENFN